jgi:hypothetical protein
MKYTEAKNKVREDILLFLKDGNLMFNQIKKLTNKSESLLRPLLCDMLEKKQISYKEVFTGKANAYQYTLKVKDDKPKYNKYLTMKWESK